MNQSSIQLLGLMKSFDDARAVLAIEHLDFRSGELTCILGPTGCGKTTLLNILAGVDRAFSGEVIFSPGPRPTVSYQFQKDLLLPWKTVRENLLTAFFATNRTIDQSVSEDLLSVLDLLPFAESYPASLSTGTRQRVAIGRALAWNGVLRLFDEPLSAQDFHHRNTLKDILRQELRRANTINIVVTHSLEEAILLADRIVILGDTPSRVLDDFPVALTGHDESNSRLTAAYVARIIHSLTLSVIL